MTKHSENDRSNLGVIVDPLIRIQLKPGRSYQNQLVNQSHTTAATVSRKWDGKELLSTGEVKKLWKEIHGADSLREMETSPRRKVYLHELLMGSEIMLPKLEIPERNPVLEKRVAALRNSLAEKEYQRMTQNVNCSSRRHHNPEDSIGFQMKQMNSALIAVLQFLISIACAFFFGFKGVELFIGELQLPVKLLLGIGIALIVGAAELYFLAVNIAVSEDPSLASNFNLAKSTATSSKPIIPNPNGQHLKTA